MITRNNGVAMKCVSGNQEATRPMKIDEGRLNEYIVESHDLQTDALHQMAATHEELEHIRESRRGQTAQPEQIAGFDEGRRKLLQNLGIGGIALRVLPGAGIAGALTSLLATPASADTSLDTQILQTASSLEILAVATYEAALGLDFIKNGNPVVVKFAMTTMDQHSQHNKAFQDQTKTLGGKIQDKPNTKYAPVVEAAKPTLKTPADVVKLAATLEQVATETYLSDLNQFGDAASRKLMASIMGVESQHLATLRAVGALLAGGAPELIAIPTDVAKLPGAAGSVAFPDPFEGVSKASPPSEGAVA